MSIMGLIGGVMGISTHKKEMVIGDLRNFAAYYLKFNSVISQRNMNQTVSIIYRSI